MHSIIFKVDESCYKGKSKDNTLVNLYYHCKTSKSIVQIKKCNVHEMWIYKWCLAGWSVTKYAYAQFATVHEGFDMFVFSQLVMHCICQLTVLFYETHVFPKVCTVKWIV